MHTPTSAVGYAATGLARVVTAGIRLALAAVALVTGMLWAVSYTAPPHHGAERCGFRIVPAGRAWLIFSAKEFEVLHRQPLVPPPAPHGTCVILHRGTLEFVVFARTLDESPALTPPGFPRVMAEEPRSWRLRLPLSLVCLILGAWPGGRLALSWIRHTRGSRPDCCAGCGYSLAGNLSGVCPECGTPIRPDKE
jgi:hypothetical protein